MPPYGSRQGQHASDWGKAAPERRCTVPCVSTPESHPLEQAILDQIAAELGVRNVSVSALARGLNRDRNTLQRWVKGEREMPVPVLTAILEFLKIDPALFMARARDRLEEQQRLEQRPPAGD
jgi:transcriptional regulator with XRE-family HTH domain